MAVGTRNLATSYAHGSPKKQGRNASGQGAEEHSEVFARRVADCCRVLRMGHIDGHMGVIDGRLMGHTFVSAKGVDGSIAQWVKKNENGTSRHRR